MTIIALAPVHHERAEDVLNCQGISFEAWLARVANIVGAVTDSHCAWCAWEMGVPSAEYALHLRNGGAA